MSITRSLNKHNGIYYAYETTYEWSEAKQKKVQKKRCIGQFVPGTNEIIPNGPRGKKAQVETPVFRHRDGGTVVIPNAANTLEINAVCNKLEAFEESLANLSETVRELAETLTALANREKS